MKCIKLVYLNICSIYRINCIFVFLDNILCQGYISYQYRLSLEVKENEIYYIFEDVLLQGEVSIDVIDLVDVRVCINRKVLFYCG